jgi:flavin reductase
MHSSDVATSFKEAMRRLAAGVAVLTTRHNGRRFGMTATAVTSLSMAPPSMLACINERASIHGAIAASGLFSVNLLATEHECLGRRFSTKPDGEARFELGNWREDEEGIPVLADCQASIACKLAAITRYGTHTIFIGDVVRVISSRPSDPLLYLNGSFGRFATLQAKEPAGDQNPRPIERGQPDRDGQGPRA